MRKASFEKYKLKFKQPVLTSRGGMSVKNGYYLSISENEKTGRGECSFIEGLSIDNLEKYEETLSKLCNAIQNNDSAILPDLTLFPSIKFGWECAELDLKNGGTKIFFESNFTKGKKQIPINGLVWMGTPDFMLQQIDEKLANGFKCIKIKVGALDFEKELKFLDHIRKQFSPQTIEIRLDANGAFKKENVFKKLELLANYSIHSIEQPVKAGQHDLMKQLCKSSPIAIALDEELIGVSKNEKENLLSFLNPQYIILKPSLLGGIELCNEWVHLAEYKKIGWWATSALESNIGLNAIAQWAFIKGSSITHGLGTGNLYINNTPSPLFVSEGKLGYHTN